MELQIEELNSSHKLDEFMCSNCSLDTYLKNNAYYENIMKFANTKIVTINEKIVAYFTIEFKNIEIEEDEITEKYPTVYLKCLAIDDKYKNNGIGTILLQHITVEAKRISEFIGCRCLLIDALSDKVSWYQDRGFQYLDEDNCKQDDITIPMFIDFRDYNLVIDYFEEV